MADSPKKWNKCTVAELKAELVKRKLNTSGKKLDLVERLLKQEEPDLICEDEVGEVDDDCFQALLHGASETKENETDSATENIKTDNSVDSGEVGEQQPEESLKDQEQALDTNLENIKRHSSFDGIEIGGEQPEKSLEGPEQTKDASGTGLEYIKEDSSLDGGDIGDQQAEEILEVPQQTKHALDTGLESGPEVANTMVNNEIESSNSANVLKEENMDTAEREKSVEESSPSDKIGTEKTKRKDSEISHSQKMEVENTNEVIEQTENEISRSQIIEAENTNQVTEKTEKSQPVPNNEKKQNEPKSSSQTSTEKPSTSDNVTATSESEKNTNETVAAQKEKPFPDARIVFEKLNDLRRYKIPNRRELLKFWPDLKVSLSFCFYPLFKDDLCSEYFRQILEKASGYEMKMLNGEKAGAALLQFPTKAVKEWALKIVETHFRHPEREVTEKVQQTIVHPAGFVNEDFGHLIKMKSLNYLIDNNMDQNAPKMLLASNIPEGVTEDDLLEHFPDMYAASLYPDEKGNRTGLAFLQFGSVEQVDEYTTWNQQIKLKGEPLVLTPYASTPTGRIQCALLKLKTKVVPNYLKEFVNHTMTPEELVQRKQEGIRMKELCRNDNKTDEICQEIADKIEFFRGVIAETLQIQQKLHNPNFGLSKIKSVTRKMERLQSAIITENARRQKEGLPAFKPVAKNLSDDFDLSGQGVKYKTFKVDPNHPKAPGKGRGSRPTFTAGAPQQQAPRGPGPAPTYGGQPQPHHQGLPRGPGPAQPPPQNQGLQYGPGPAQPPPQNQGPPYGPGPAQPSPQNQGPPYGPGPAQPPQHNQGPPYGPGSAPPFGGHPHPPLGSNPSNYGYGFRGSGRGRGEFRGRGAEMRGRGAEVRGRGGDIRGRGADKRGRGSEFRGRGGEFRGRGYDQHRGRGGDAGLRGSGRGDLYQGRGGDHAYRGRGDSNRGRGDSYRGRGQPFFGGARGEGYKGGRGRGDYTRGRGRGVGYNKPDYHEGYDTRSYGEDKKSYDDWEGYDEHYKEDDYYYKEGKHSRHDDEEDYREDDYHSGAKRKRYNDADDSHYDYSESSSSKWSDDHYHTKGGYDKYDDRRKRDNLSQEEQWAKEWEEYEKEQQYYEGRKGEKQWDERDREWYDKSHDQDEWHDDWYDDQRDYKKQKSTDRNISKERDIDRNRSKERDAGEPRKSKSQDKYTAKTDMLSKRSKYESTTHKELNKARPDARSYNDSRRPRSRSPSHGKRPRSRSPPNRHRRSNSPRDRRPRSRTPDSRRKSKEHESSSSKLDSDLILGKIQEALLMSKPERSSRFSAVPHEVVQRTVPVQIYPAPVANTASYQHLTSTAYPQTVVPSAAAVAIQPQIYPVVTDKRALQDQANSLMNEIQGLLATGASAAPASTVVSSALAANYGYMGPNAVPSVVPRAVQGVPPVSKR